MRLAECLLALAPQAALEAALATYVPAFRAALAVGVLKRLGLASRSPEEDGALSEAFWAFLAESGVGFEQAFFDWFGGAASAHRARSGPAAALYTGPAFAAFEAALSGYAACAPDRLSHPYFARTQPCTMLIEEVERVWAPIAEADDWSVFHAKVAAAEEMGRAYGNVV